MNNNEVVVKKNINELVPNKYQPRKYFDEKDLIELSNSIKNYGIINPILVRQLGDKYEIIAGERRYRAAKMSGLTEVPVIVKNVTDKESAELALIENLHRQDLTAIEAAKSYEEILKIGNYTQTDLANKIGKSQSAIANKLRLLTLPEEIQNAVIEKKISERHARSLLEIDNKEKQLEILNRIINEKLTVKETEDLIDLENTSNEDIERAIKDIMKSMNINEEKEEKESDNMNNGNFFPNYDNNMMPNNNVNPPMPEQNQPIISQENVMPTFVSGQNNNMEPVTPVINPTLEINNISEGPQMSPQGFAPQQEIPSFGPAQQPTISNTTDIPVTEPSNPVFDTPLFNPNMSNNTFQQPSMPEQNQPMYEPNNMNPSPIEEFQFTNVPTEPSTPITPIETPLFTPSMPQENLNESFAPVDNNQTVETQQTDRFTEVTNLLNSNGINYKSYSNETGHCIIIEL